MKSEKLQEFEDFKEQYSHDRNKQLLCSFNHKVYPSGDSRTLNNFDSNELFKDTNEPEPEYEFKKLIIGSNTIERAVFIKDIEKRMNYNT